MKPIVIIPDPVLTTLAKPVTRFDRKLKNLIADMSETLVKARNPRGVGIAAPQIGESWRVFLIKPNEKAKIAAFVNPEIVSQSELIERDTASDKKLEGCLSIPLVWGKVKRSAEVTLRYQDVEGHTREETFTGFPAVIIQHETDHLNGTLFTHRVVAQNGPLYETVKDKDGKETLEEITLI